MLLLIPGAENPQRDHRRYDLQPFQSPQEPASMLLLYRPQHFHNGLCISQTSEYTYRAITVGVIRRHFCSWENKRVTMSIHKR